MNTSKTWLKKAIVFLVIAAMAIALFPFTGLKMVESKADDPYVTPEHSKTAHDNGDGTYTLELSVTGDADDSMSAAGNVNVLIIYDTSSSMTSNAQGSSYTRADQAEDVVHDFLTGLVKYQNEAKNNINVALVTFARYTDQHNSGQTWTTEVQGLADRFDDGGTDRQTSFSYSGNQANGTNWEAALIKANGLIDTAPGNGATPTFVLMMTDGACTASGNGNNAINPSGASITALRPFYSAATDPAETLATACAATGATTHGTFYGIYAYGTEADLVDDLMYYSVNGEHRGGSINNVVAATEDAPNFFRAADTTALNTAITEIFNQVVNALGISSVSISDGTTNKVETSTGVSELLEVDENSYKYWLSIPVVNNQFTRKMNVMVDGVSQVVDVVYTVTDNGEGTCDVNWTENGSAKRVTVNGSVSSGSFKYQWTATNDLYKFDPPVAHLVDGAVDWDLSDVGTLLDDVTYSVTFKVYPSQETLDIVADIKNEPGDNGAWAKLDPAIQNCIDKNGNLKTNTEASLSWIDTRETDPETHKGKFTNPDPVENSAVEQLAVTKDWDNALESTWKKPNSITLNVTRDNDPHYTVTLSDSTQWEGSVYISVGIMGANRQPLAGSEGHDFTFTEPQIQGENFKWEINSYVVHPMLINNNMTMLVKVDDKHPMPEGIDDDDIYEFNEATYYVSEAATSLTATNERRSSLNIVKVVDGDDAPSDAVFPFTLNVENSEAPEEAPSAAEDPNHDSDWWIWISIWDEDQQAVTQGAVVSGATYSGGSWYYGESGKDIVLNIKAGYSIRVNNLPTGSTYTITEGEELPTAFRFSSAAIKFTEGRQPESEDWEFTGGRTSTGSIDSTNAVYTVTYTNEYALVNVKAYKKWNDDSNRDGVRPQDLALTLNIPENAPEGTTAPTPVITNKNTDTWTYTWSGLPKYDDEGAELSYTITEGTVPDGYTCETKTVNAGGTITNVHTPETISIDVEKKWIGPKGDAVTVTLYANDTATEKTVTLNAGNEWKGTFSNLPVYATGQVGQEIKYSVVETGVTGVDTDKYTTVVTGNPDDGYIITNTNKETVTVTAYKEWNDDSNRDGVRPQDLALTLNIPENAPEGTTAPTPVITNKNTDTWTYTWSGLPKYDDEGAELSYTITEGTIPDGYTCETTTVNAGGKITNTHSIATTTVTVTKVWNDEDDWDGSRPDSVTFQLKANNVNYREPVTIGVDEDGEWTIDSYTWENLPVNDNGKPIQYTVTENAVPNYQTSIENAVDDETEEPIPNEFIVTNSYTPGKTSVVVTKVWDDNEDEDEIRPTSVEIVLYKTVEGDAEAKVAARVTLDGTIDPVDPDNPVDSRETAKWTATFSNLPMKDHNKTVTYTTVKETITEVITGEDTATTYSYTVTGDATDGFTVTNTHTPIPKFGDLIIEKTLEAFSILPEAGEVTFIYHIVATIDGENGEEEVFNDYAALNFSKADVNVPKKIKIEGLPAGATVTVTEENDGAGYKSSDNNPKDKDGHPTVSNLVITDSSKEGSVTAKAEFKNTYDDTFTGGYGAVNHYEKNENEDGTVVWTGSNIGDNSMPSEDTK